MGHMTLTIPIRRVCHRKASTWYILPAYKIWRLSLQPLQRYDCRRWNWQGVMWLWPRPSWGGLSSVS